MNPLSTPLPLRGITLRNRIGLPPMCTYRAHGEGLPDPHWHHAHYLTRSVGAGLVIVEATAVSPEGRVTPHDLGIWNHGQMTALGRIAEAISSQDAVPGIQICHGGRKASRTRPWGESGDQALTGEDGWTPLGPSAVPFADGYPTPQAMTGEDINRAITQFAMAASRAAMAGFKLLELHAGHGRLLHTFLSPLANHRTDIFGGSFDNRVRLLRRTVRAVRTQWPDHLPLAVRLSATDFHPGGWTLNDTVRLAPLLAADGADLIDCTSGGITRPELRPTGPAWQAPYAAAVRRTGVPTAAVGKITTLEQAEHLLAEGVCDLALMGRQLLADPMLLARRSPGLAPAPYRRALASVAADRRLPPEL